MSDPMEEQSTEEGDGSTAGNVNKGKRKEYKDRSEVWSHYDRYKDVNGKVRALCKYCKVCNYSGDSTHGTSNLWNHNRKCLFNPNKEGNTQTQLELNSSNDVETGESKVCLQIGKFNQEKARRSIVEMLIIDELPFKFVDNEGYRRSMKICQPPGIPESKDWTNARLLVVFLKHFYDLTLRVSGTKYITSNSYLECINCLDTVLKRCFLTKDNDLKCMSIEMMKKFDKYWGDTKKFNMLVFIASVFDPRTKFEYLKVNICSMYGTEEGNEDGNQVVTLCRNALKELFNDYKRIYADQHQKNVASTSQASHNQSKYSSVECLDTSEFGVFEDTMETMRKKNMDEIKRRKAASGIAKEELDRYLTEEIEGDGAYFESDKFTVLGWWKKRSPAFPILSLVARDILAIPVSTVASESTFSTGGRVLDSFRTSLTPQIVEALICCQDWIRKSHAPINVEEKIEDLEKFEEEMRNISIESSVDME